MELPKAQLKSAKLQGDGAFEVDVKRFYIPVTMVADCPHCGQEVVQDFSQGDYLSYPTANKPTEFSMYHVVDKASGEAHEFNVPIVLKISIEPVKL